MRTLLHVSSGYFSALMAMLAAALLAFALSLWLVVHVAPLDPAPLLPLYEAVWG